MEFKAYLKKLMMGFFVSVTCITAAMALVGMMFEPDTRFGYEALFSPLIFGFAATLISLVKYSKKELTLKSMLIRNLLHFILLEAVILLILYFVGALTDISIAVSLAVSVLLIDITVNLVLWVNDKKTAKKFNTALKQLQSDNSAE